MIKSLICTTITLLLCGYPALAIDHNAFACNDKTGDCYDAEADLDFGVITIYFDDTNYKTLQLDATDTEEIFAYDKDNDAYYNIDIVK